MKKTALTVAFLLTCTAINTPLYADYTESGVCSYSSYTPAFNSGCSGKVPGTWAETCCGNSNNPITCENNTLEALCEEGDGRTLKYSSINFKNCGGEVSNKNGNLECTW